MDKYRIVWLFCCAVSLLSCQKQKETVISFIEKVVPSKELKSEDPISGSSIAPDKDDIKEDMITEEHDTSEDHVFLVAETMPEFPGGMTALMEFIANNMKYPVSAQENGIQGRVMLQFVVNRDGSITNIEVIRGIDPALDKEAIRIVKSMPKWNPGMQRGKAVRIKYTMPVNFKLQQ